MKIKVTSENKTIPTTTLSWDQVSSTPGVYKVLESNDENHLSCLTFITLAQRLWRGSSITLWISDEEHRVEQAVDSIWKTYRFIKSDKKIVLEFN